MTALLNWRVWAAVALAVVLAFTHFTAYRSGKAVVRAEWTAEKLKQTEQLAAFNAESRRIEQRRQSLVTEALNAAKKREIKIAADAGRARDESEWLRSDIAAIRADLPRLTRDAVNRYADAASVVFDQCQREYQDMAANADRFASDRQTLMDAWPK